MDSEVDPGAVLDLVPAGPVQKKHPAFIPALVLSTQSVNPEGGASLDLHAACVGHRRVRTKPESSKLENSPEVARFRGLQSLPFPSFFPYVLPDRWTNRSKWGFRVYVETHVKSHSFSLPLLSVVT